MENTFVLKLSDGADILEGIKKLAKEKEIGYGLFVSGFGKIKEFELLSSGSQGSIERMKSREESQVNAVSGKIQKKGGSFDVLLRVSVTKTGFTPKGGQLIQGKAAISLEIGIRKVDLKKIIEA